MKRERSRHIECCCDGVALFLKQQVRMSTSAAAGRRERKVDAFAHIVEHFVVTGVIAMMSSMWEMLVLNCFDIDGQAAVRREGEKA